MNSTLPFLADARYSVTVPANSSAAVAAAVKKKINRVLVEPICAPGDEENTPDLFFGPLFCEEAAALKNIPIMEWIKNYFQKYDLPRVDSLDDLLAVNGLEELWLHLPENPKIIEQTLSILKQNFSDEKRFVLASRMALPKGLPFRCADPTGFHDFLLCSGSLRDRLHHFYRWHKSVSFRSNGFSAIRTKVIL